MSLSPQAKRPRYDESVQELLTSTNPTPTTLSQNDGANGQDNATGNLFILKCLFIEFILATKTPPSQDPKDYIQLIHTTCDYQEKFKFLRCKNTLQITGI